MSWNRSTSSRARLRQAAHFQIEGLERRLFLSSAIAAFSTQQTFATGSNPRSVAVADVNTDGKLDLIVANSVSNTAGIMLGNGNGTFQAQQTFTVGTTPFSVAVADVNADGKLDLLTANNGSNNVSLLLGNGNGTFQAQKTFGAGVNPRYVAVADVNGDGKPDLLVANYNSAGSGSVSVLLGNGNGTFQNQQTFATGIKPSSIAVADFNVDGKLDLAVANKGSNNVSILLGNSNGTFQNQQVFTVGTAPFSVATGDLNQDGKIDLAVANESTNAVSVLLGNGNGTFQAQQTFATGTIPASVAISDVNGDGKPDLAVANYSSNTVSVLLGNGNGTFQPQKTFATGASPFALAVSDVNRDGRQDLLVANEGSNSVSVFLGDVPPSVLSINRTTPPGPVIVNTSTVSYTVTFSEPVTGVDAADFSLALSGVTAATPVVVSGSGTAYSVTVNGISRTGTLGVNLTDDGSIHDAAGNPLRGSLNTVYLQPQQTIAVSGPNSLATADVNGDGRPDLLVTGGLSVSVLLGNGNGTFQAAQALGTNTLAFFVTAADVNGDGKPDLVVANFNNVLIFLGNGDGTFQAPETLTAGSDPRFIAVSDVNGDGKSDLVVSNYASNSLSVLLGNGNGTFQAQQTLATGTGPQSVVVSDVNGDGKPDLMVANYRTHNVSAMLGNGDGTFQAQQTFAAGSTPTSVTTFDLNSDGRADLVVASRIGDEISVLLGNGNGTFQTQQTFFAGSGPVSVAVADLNGDGRPDLAVAGETYYACTLLGNGNGTFKPQQTFATGVFSGNPFASTSVAVSDLNDDGRSDVSVLNENGNFVSLLLGRDTNGNFSGQVYTVVPVSVLAINRFAPAAQTTNSRAVTFAVSFNNPVTGVEASDFQVVTTGSAVAAGPISVSGSGASYTVTVGGIRGSGTLQFDLIDNDNIHDNFGTPLGGTGLYNGSFVGQSYTILQTFPSLLSINRASPAGPTASTSSVSYTVTFSEPVTGVDPTDFALALSGVTATTPVVVSGSGATYTVAINGISGIGTLGLNLADDGSIRDATGNPLQSAGAAFQSQQTLATGRIPNSVAVADINGDGIPDLMVSNAGDSTVSVMLGNGNGTFRTQQALHIFISAGTTIAVSDLNGDGKPDLAVTYGGSNFGVVSVSLGNGDGTFQTAQTFATTPNPGQLAIADVNSDGKPDVINGDSFGEVSVLLGNGDGTLKPSRTYFIPSVAPFALAISDVNADGTADLLVANDPIGSGVFFGNGDGTFQAFQTLAAGTSLNSVTAADVNGDGKPDIVTTNFRNNTVIALLGNGDGTFGAPQTVAAGSDPSSIITTDVNGDGQPDLIVNNGLSNNVSVLLGNGNGSFQSQQTFATGRQPTSVAAADLNGDGKPDLVVINYAYSATVGVLLGNSNGNFTGQVYAIVPPADTITGTSGSDSIMLTKDTGGTDIDWTMGASSGMLPITDPHGLTINGNGGSDTINLNYGSGGTNNPLPNTIHLNGTFTINGLSISNPLANTNLETGRSTVYISYSSSPLALIQGYLKNGYNNGTWNGVPAASTGVITSLPAAQNALQTTAIGYADSADGVIAGQPANTIELKYTLYGDTTLAGAVGSAAFTTLTLHYHQTAGGTWDTGDFNYDGSVNFSDFTLLTRTYNTSLGSQAVPSVQASSTTTTRITSTATNSGPQTPVVRTKPASLTVHHHKPAPKHPKKHRR